MSTTKEQRAEWLRLEREALRARARTAYACGRSGYDPILDAAARNALRPLCEHVEAMEAELARLRRLEAASVRSRSGPWT